MKVANHSAESARLRHGSLQKQKDELAGKVQELEAALEELKTKSTSREGDVPQIDVEALFESEEELKALEEDWPSVGKALRTFVAKIGNQASPAAQREQQPPVSSTPQSQPPQEAGQVDQIDYTQKLYLDRQIEKLITLFLIGKKLSKQSFSKTS